MTAARRRLGNRYEVGPLLGHGGMGEVHLGRDERLGRDVAIKVLRADLASDPSFQSRFRREAQSAAGLNHPAIVAVYDTSQDTDGDNPQAYIVMEYVDGRTLRDLLDTEHRLLPRRALEITAEVCSALDYSHRHGIVHRDVKPANVMLDRAGAVKVMDFGIARAVTASQATMTQTAAVIGTAHYLSPEQARGEHVDARSDIYSTGCLLYELLTGMPPFRGDSPVSVAYQHVRENPVPPSQVDADIRPEVDAVVLKAMAKNPANRYQTAAEMRDDIARALAGHPVLATPVLPDPNVVPPRATGSDTTLLLRRPAYRGRRGWVGYLLLGVGLLAVVVAAALLAGALLVNRGTDVEMPDLTGRTAAQAASELRTFGLVPGRINNVFNPAPVGVVFDQSPKPRDRVRRGSSVDLFVSRGMRQVRVPSLVGRSQDEAQAALKTAGLGVGVITPKDSSRPVGEVLDSDPKAGAAVAAGSPVSLVVSRGSVLIPNVVGDSEATARSKLAAAGLNVIVRRVEAGGLDPGTVLDQNPPSGSRVTTGSTVRISVVVTPSPSPSGSPSPSASASASPSPSATGSPSPTPSGTTHRTDSRSLDSGCRQVRNAAGGPADLGRISVSRPKATSRCRSENLGLQVVKVSRAAVGDRPGYPGTGAVTCTSVGATTRVSVTR